MAFGNFLPVYMGRTHLGTMKRIFRSRERVLICLVFLTFLLVCLCPIFFLPELRGGLSSKAENVYKVYRDLQKAAPELILPPPHPLPNSVDEKAGYVRDHEGVLRSPGEFQNDVHIIEDRQRLQNKINNEVIEKPVVLGVSSTVRNENNNINSGAVQLPEINKNEKPSKQITPSAMDDNLIHHPGSPLIQEGEDPDPIIAKRREKIKEMMLHAWRGYKAYAWGRNELRPLSKRGHSAGIFGRQDMGASIVDAMDTLYIMGLMDEFNEGRMWMRDNLDFNKLKSEMSVFEVNIRFVGGLLTLYSFTDDPLFRDKALHIARKLLPAFETPTGIPFAIINVGTGLSKNYAWASGGSSILSEFGTLHLEFMYLSDITGDPVFREKALKIRDVIRKLARPDGLYPNYLNPKSGKWGQRHTTIGAMGDSFYEYLLKAYIQSGYKDMVARDMYENAMDALIEKLLFKSKSGLTYFAESKFDRIEHKMDHLACFASGMFGFGSHLMKEEKAKRHFELGGELANTCHESYIRTATGLGPESFRFSESIEAKALKTSEKYYILRPEVIEGWFYMWRLTHEKKYRDWAWEAVLALEKHCRVEAGFSGIQNVYMENPQKDDVQQSFLFAETFKYLYLIFSNDDLISLDEWVLNTEAHPLPIYGQNSFYRPAKGMKPMWELEKEKENIE